MPRRPKLHIHKRSDIKGRHAINACVTCHGIRSKKYISANSHEEAMELAREWYEGVVNPTIDSQAYIEMLAYWNRTATRRLNRMKERAIAGGWPFDFTKQKLLDLFTECGGRCVLTNVPFSFRKDVFSKKQPYLPSVDRINPALGYVPGNVRLVCLALNVAINEWGETLFRKLCKEYIDNGMKLRRRSTSRYESIPKTLQ